MPLTFKLLSFKHFDFKDEEFLIDLKVYYFYNILFVLEYKENKR